jgi:UDP-N-acetyl-D-mannosaminuronic acid dehydrogenase
MKDGMGYSDYSLLGETYMKISVLGLGYIGLPNALLLASNGHEVIGIDIDSNKIDMINNGELPFEEPGLSDLFSEAKPNFKASTEVEESEVYIIAVPTPLDKEMKMANLKAVKSASQMIAEKVKDGDLVILESTVPPGTSKNFIIPILKKHGEKEIFYSHCPERAIPGKTLYEMQNNDRIVGGLDEDSTRKTVDLYGSFVKGNMFETDVTTAEFIKLMENTYRDINIALANEFALISEEIGIDVWEAIKLANKHPRVDILSPGPGVGGHCIAIDPWFMVEKSSKSKIVTLAREINDFMPIQVVRNAKELIFESGIPKWSNPKITILGMAYKGNVDDTRESPAFKVQRIAESEGIDVSFYDPHIESNGLSLEEAVEDSDCLILITDHDVFQEIDPKKLLIRHKNVVDTRNILDHRKWIDAGFNVKILGNGK